MLVRRDSHGNIALLRSAISFVSECYKHVVPPGRGRGTIGERYKHANQTEPPPIRGK